MEPSTEIGAALQVCFSFLKRRHDANALLIVPSDSDAIVLCRLIASCRESESVLGRLTIQFVPKRSSRIAASRQCRRTSITPQTMEWLVFLQASNFHQYQLVVLINFLSHLRASVENSTVQQFAWHCVGPYRLQRKESKIERQLLLSTLSGVSGLLPTIII